jgi:D-threo-aldose 1-dehydrogenase
MKHDSTRLLGRTGLEVTALGFGGAPLGDLYELSPEERVERTIETAWEEGIRLFDTSPLYGAGLSEHRLGYVLRRKPRDAFVLSTKVGRLLEPRAGTREETGLFAGGLRFAPVYDYSYDGCMRSIEDSYQRLGINRIDIALIHDVDAWIHGPDYERRFGEAMEGAYRALDDLRSAGIIRAVGAGLNEVEPCVRFAKAGDFDCFLLAGRYTLLEQDGLDDLLPLAEAQQFSILLGGPFNSGILATGAKPGARYNYTPAPPEIMQRVDAIERVCEAHGVPLAAAAIQFPLGHQRIASIIPGAVSPEEVSHNRALMGLEIPAALWDDLKTEGLLLASAPVPS